ncbi:MAG: putative protein YyaP [Chlamydiia bacterium]|nr:putative protein YyaP [Chlamydiia bacterium]
MPQHPKVTVYIARSIDGYIAKKDGNLDFLSYGHKGDEDYGFSAFKSSVDAVIMGRNTYDVVDQFDPWAYAGKRVIVLSSTLRHAREEVEVYQGDLPPLLQRLDQEGIKHIWVDGGVTATQFLAQGLVNELIISQIAILIGDGIPLFTPFNRELPCKLLSHKSFPSGLVQTHYHIL